MLYFSPIKQIGSVICERKYSLKKSSTHLTLEGNWFVYLNLTNQIARLPLNLYKKAMGTQLHNHIHIGQWTRLLVREEREDIVKSCFVLFEIMEEVIFQFEVTWHVR